jgi:V/A-type H+-transporting ATPase subunit E
LTKTLGDITSELTERVISPAKSESERILRDAEENAKKILSDARKEALNTKNAAIQEAEKVLNQMEVDLNTAARNFILLLQEQLEQTIAHATVNDEIREVLNDKEFLKKIIEIVVQEFIKLGGAENNIEILLPVKEKEELGNWFLGKFQQRVFHNVNVHFTDKVSFGFKIGIEDTGSHFNFGGGMVEAFKNFCSPRFRKYFFTEKEG